MRTLPATEGDLIAALHEGVFEQPLWHSFLELLRIHAKASCSCLIFRPSERDAMVLLFAGTEPPEHFQRIFRERYEAAPLPHQTMREGRIYDLDQLIDPGDPFRQSFYADMLAPGGGRYLRTVRITEQSGVDAWLSIVSDNDFGAVDSSLLSRIVPHFRMALRNFVALERERFRSSISSEAFGRLNFGWITLDAKCRILDTTPNVEQIFKRTSLLRRGRYNRLTFASASLDRQVTALVGRFAFHGESQSQAINLNQDPWMDMLITPVQPHLVSPGSSSVAIIYLNGDQWSRSDRCEQLVDLFGLLPSEARLAWAIAQGLSIAKAAETLGLTLETARNYSKKIYAKTGASGQADLVRIIFTSVLAIV